MYFPGFIQRYVKKLLLIISLKEVFDIDRFRNNEEDRVKYFDREK